MFLFKWFRLLRKEVEMLEETKSVATKELIKLLELNTNSVDLSLGTNNEEEIKMNNNKNVEVPLNTNPKEELTMTNTNRVPSETELLSQLMGNLNNKEEQKMKVEVKFLAEGIIQRALIIDKGSSYLVEPYTLEIDIDNESVSYRYYPPYTLDKELEDWEYVLFFEEDEEMEEQTMINMDLQFFASKEQEESAMLEQIERFNDVAKQIEEIDAVGGEVYVGEVKVSWESVKQFMYGLSDDELKLLAYSNNPAIPAELEIFAIYLLEAEKAWDNELSLQNAYFNGQSI